MRTFERPEVGDRQYSTVFQADHVRAAGPDIVTCSGSRRPGLIFQVKAYLAKLSVLAKAAWPGVKLDRNPRAGAGQTGVLELSIGACPVVRGIRRIDG